MLPGATSLYAMSLMITEPRRVLHGRHPCSTKTHRRNRSPRWRSCRAAHVRRFGIEPKIALLAHSDFGSHDDRSSRKMREALALVRERAPELEVDGEMQADTALSQATRDLVLPSSRLKGEANVLVMPNLDAANIAFQMAKVVADALPVGPILIGVAQPAHILTPSVSARGIVNMTAIAVAEAQAEQDNVHRLAAQ